MWYKFENFPERDFPIYSSAQTRRGQIVGGHYHGAMELMQICTGEPLLTVDTTQLRCRPGDLFFIPAYAVHSLEAAEECSIRGITFEPALLDGALCGVDLAGQFARERIGDPLCREGHPLHPAMEQAFERVYDAYHTASPTRRPAILSALYALLEVLLKRYASVGQKEHAYRRLEPAIRYMEDHLAEELSLEQISALLNICPDHCIRLFREQTHKTPMRYLSDLRIAEAMKLLVETELPVGEIAARCGYSSANYLSKAFKDRLKKTPTEYRRQGFTRGTGFDIIMKKF